MAALEHQGMKAPASTEYQIVDIPNPYSEVIQRLGVPGKFVGAQDVDSPWVPFGPNAAMHSPTSSGSSRRASSAPTSTAAQ